MEPPKKDSEPTEENVRKLEQWLTSFIAGHPNAINTYTFYEEIDKYLGPWGKDGYPIGYGKKYNVLFTTNPHLKTNVDVQDWVWKTTIILQKELRDFIVQAYKDGKLNPAMYFPNELKRDLKEAAFRSHHKAYVDGGLTIVAMTSPDMILEIINIPRKEFFPLSPNFEKSVCQVMETIDMLVPEIAGGTLAVLSGPAHTLSFQHSHQKDVNNLMEHKKLIESLRMIKLAIDRRELDAPPILDQVITKLTDKTFPDMNTSRYAREVIEAARMRKMALAYEYRMEVAIDPSLKPFYDKYLKGWNQP